MIENPTDEQLKELERLRRTQICRAGQRVLAAMDDFAISLRSLLVTIEVASRRDAGFVDPPDHGPHDGDVPLPHAAHGTKKPGGGR